MTLLLLTESTHLGEKSGALWNATLITPGKGSSGTYSEDMLSKHTAAFPKGTKLFFGHPKDDQGPGERDPRDQWGVLDEDSKFKPGTGITGKVRVLPHAKDIVESLGSEAALSVYAMGESDDKGNITALHPDVTNSVDMVAYPGRPGSGLTEKMLEAFRIASEKPDATSAQEKQEKELMDEKTLEALKKAFSEALAPVIAFVTKSESAAQAADKAKAEADAKAKPVEDAVAEAVGAYDAKVKLIDDAKLLPSQAESLRAAAKRGEDVAPLIEEAKKIVDEAKKVVTEGALVLNGRLVEGAGTTGFAVEGMGA